MHLTDKTMLDKIINNTLDTVSSSKEQIFEIGEQSRVEYAALERELIDVRLNVAKMINKNDQLDIFARTSRNRLAEVSKSFDKYSSQEVQSAYEQASKYQVQLAVLGQEEIQLRERRDLLERRLVSLRGTVKRAEELANQMTVVYSFLTNELKHVGEAIEDARERQAFGLQIIEAQEEERKRLSREIHDGPAQMMANVMLRAELVERIYNEKGIDEALKEIRDLRSAVKSSLEEVRRIIYDLRPMALDDLGLIPTVTKYLDTFQTRNNVSISFLQIGQNKRLPQRFEIAIFRLIQEAVQNAYKHAESTDIQVKIEIKLKKVIIIIKDDGKGFDPSMKKEGSFGLMGMKERVNMLKGKMTIQSKLKVGTMILIDLPISS